MKGFEVNILLMFEIIIIFMFIGAILGNMLYRKTNVDINLFSDIFMDIDALRASRIYAETAVDFSFYQAFYELSSNGFEISVDGKTPEQSYIINKIKNRMFEMISEYTDLRYRFMRDTIKLPEYNNIEIYDIANKTRIIAKSDNDLIVEHFYNKNKEFVVLKDNSTVKRVYDFSIEMFIKNAEMAIENLSRLDCVNINAGDTVIDNLYYGYRTTASVIKKYGNKNCHAVLNVTIIYEPSFIVVYDDKPKLINPSLNFTINI